MSRHQADALLIVMLLASGFLMGLATTRAWSGDYVLGTVLVTLVIAVTWITRLRGGPS